MGMSWNAIWAVLNQQERFCCRNEYCYLWSVATLEASSTCLLIIQNHYYYNWINIFKKGNVSFAHSSNSFWSCFLFPSPITGSWRASPSVTWTRSGWSTSGIDVLCICNGCRLSSMNWRNYRKSIVRRTTSAKTTSWTSSPVKRRMIHRHLNT